MITFRKPGSQESHQEPPGDYSGATVQALQILRDRGDWFNPLTQPFGAAFLLATDHVVYGTGLSIYDYLGTVRDRGCCYYAFVTEQTSGGNGPRRTGRHWATEAIALVVGRDGRYVNPAQICLIEKNDRDPEIFGNKLTQRETDVGGFQGQLRAILKHYVDDHPELFEAICGTYIYRIGEERWQAAMSRIWQLLQFDQLDANSEHCNKDDCFLLHELRMAWKDNFSMSAPPRMLPPEPWNDAGGRAPRDKLRPSRELCRFLTERTICFDPAKHRIEWAHMIPRKPLPLHRPQK